MRAGGGICRDCVAVVFIHCMAETSVMPVNIPRIARRTALSQQEILWIDCRKVSVTRAILVSSIVAVSYIRVNGMGMIRREVSPIFYNNDPVLVWKEVDVVVREGVDFDGVRQCFDSSDKHPDAWAPSGEREGFPAEQV